MKKERQLQVAVDTEFALRLDLVLVVVLVIVFYVTQGTIVSPSRSRSCTHSPSTDTRAGDAPIAVDCWFDPSES